MRNYVDKIHPRSMRRLAVALHQRVREHLWAKIIVGMVLGIGVGIAAGPEAGLIKHDVALTIGEWLAIPGQLFLTVVQMIVIPLVFASIIRGIAAGEDPQQLKKVGGRLVVYFLCTTTIAIVIGLAMAYLIRPGVYLDIQTVSDTVNQTAAGEQIAQDTLDMSVPQMIVGLLPSNPIRAMVESQMLQIVMFAIVFGMALISMAPKQAKPLLELLGTVQEVCMAVVQWAMKLAPFAVFGLLAQITIRVGLDAIVSMSVYVLTVLAGLAMMLVVYLIIVASFSGIGPGRFLKAVREVQLLAFSASSSAAVMPLSMETAEEKLGVRPSISQFIIPLGTSINMDGTALYQAVATIFLAQVFSVELGLAALVLIVLTTTGASIGSPATPGVGIVILSTVLAGVGIPASGIALILGVDRILDMSRTMINVTGDLTASVVMDRWVGGRLSCEHESEIEKNREEERAKAQEDVLVDA